MKTILVPTDFSQTAAGALDFACLLAKKIEDARILLLHAWELPVPVAGISYDMLHAEKEEKTRQALYELNALAAEKKSGGFSIEVLALEGVPEELILEQVRDRHIDLVVMGTLGNTGIGTEIFGSTASHILEKAPCPVLAIPPMAAGMKSLHKITYATDFRNGDINAIRQLSILAAPFHAQLNILHIAGEKISAEEERLLMKNFMEKVNASVTYNNLSYQIIHGADKEAELQSYLDSESTDIIVFSTHRRNLFEKIFGMSLTRQIALNSSVPVMAFHTVPKAPIVL